MWFKNIRFYCFSKPFALGAEALEEKLLPNAFVEGASYEKSRIGWVSPLGKEGESLTHVVGNYIMLCMRKDEKLLPASVVNDVLAEKIEEIEAQQARKITRKEKLQLKDDVIASLLPRAFSRTRKVYAYIAPKEDLFIVNSSSAAVAEEFINALREALETLPVTLPVAKISPSDVMTRWLEQQSASDGFSINQECELFNPLEDSNVVRCKGQDLASEEIQAHLSAGKQVKKLGLVWNDTLSCVLGADLGISRLKFEDMILERAEETDAESAAQQFDQDFAIMSLEIAKFMKSLASAFGGIGCVGDDS